MKYPNGILKQYQKINNTGNRGMTLENELNETNKYYLNNDIAVIYKKPTPITVNKVDYKARDNAVIKEAHFLVPSTTDYNGIYKGKYIDFEAKETKQNYLPLANIHKHQIEHLRKIVNHGGIGFIIVRFTTKNLTYCLEAKKLINFIENNERKSIPLSYFEKDGYLIKQGFRPYLDYLKFIDTLIEGVNLWKI